jgi:4-amino-4-deoxy-L-arabinose transferase-like glycosyltransferase
MIDTLKNIYNNKLSFPICIVVLALWYVLTLAYSPLPWLDEIFFASITKSLISGKGFIVAIDPLINSGNESLTYGPIYFMFTTLVWKLFGFGIVQFRIVNLVFSGLTILLFYLIQKELGIKKWIVRIATFLLMFDIMFVQNAHSGRMDFVALFFALITYFIYFKKEKGFNLIVLMSVCGGISILTTPRIAIIVLPLFFIAFYQAIKNRKIVNASLLSAIPIILYLCWIYYGFGSITAFLNYYKGTGESTNQGYLLFLGGNFNIPKYQIPLVIIGIAAFILKLKSRNTILNSIILFLPLLLFYIVVFDAGGHSAIIIPFWYLTISYSLNEYDNIRKIKRSFNVFIFSSLLVLFIVNVSSFVMKSSWLLVTLSERDPQKLDEWMKSHIKDGSKVIGDDRYYYACINRNCDFKYIDRPRMIDHTKYYKEIYKPDYIFISVQTSPDIINTYKKIFTFNEEYEYNPVSRSKWLAPIVNRIHSDAMYSYKGKLIRVSLKND